MFDSGKEIVGKPCIIIINQTRSNFGEKNTVS
jgi:hypothetical protein